MTRTFLTAAALGLMLAGAATASDDKPLDAARADEVRAALTAQGYEVREIEMDDGLYEADAVRDGQRFEVYLNQAMEIVRTERDD